MNMPSDFSKFNHPKCQIKVLLLSFFKTGAKILSVPASYTESLFLLLVLSEQHPYQSPFVLLVTLNKDNK